MKAVTAGLKRLQSEWSQEVRVWISVVVPCGEGYVFSQESLFFYYSVVILCLLEFIPFIFYFSVTKNSVSSCVWLYLSSKAAHLIHPHHSRWKRKQALWNSMLSFKLFDLPHSVNCLSKHREASSTRHTLNIVSLPIWSPRRHTHIIEHKSPYLISCKLLNAPCQTHPHRHS